MKKMQQGFTLIELMIVVAIIAILAAIALPAYNDYVTRSQVSEAVTLAGGLKAPLAEYGAQTNDWPGLVETTATPTSSQIAVNLGDPSNGLATISSTVAGTYPAGTVTANMVSGRASGTSITFVTDDGGATWDCTGGDVDDKYRPQTCR